MSKRQALFGESCPVCGAKKALYGSNFISVKAHITNTAKAEIYHKMLIEDNRPALHFDYVKENMKMIPSTQYTIRIK